VHAYPTLSSQRNRYLKLGFESVTAVNMNEYWMDILDRKEAERVDTKEMFDEEEEWKVKCAHYFIVHAYKGTKEVASSSASSTLPNEAASQQESSQEEPSFKWSQNVTTSGKNSQAKRWGHSTVLYGNLAFICENSCNYCRE
jgi:tRNA wybutosine-synthesizing protein 4